MCCRIGKDKMAKKRKIEVLKTDTIICAYARKACGPGWGNRPLWVVVKTKDGGLAERCIHPNEFSIVIDSLYDISNSLNNRLCYEILKLRDDK